MSVSENRERERESTCTGGWAHPGATPPPPPRGWRQRPHIAGRSSMPPQHCAPRTHSLFRLLSPRLTLWSLQPSWHRPTLLHKLQFCWILVLVEYIYHTVIARAVSHRRLAWLGRRALQQPVWTGFETRRRHLRSRFFANAHTAQNMRPKALVSVVSVVSVALTLHAESVHGWEWRSKSAFDTHAQRQRERPRAPPRERPLLAAP